GGGGVPPPRPARAGTLRAPPEPRPAGPGSLVGVREEAPAGARGSSRGGRTLPRVARSPPRVRAGRLPARGRPRCRASRGSGGQLGIPQHRAPRRALRAAGALPQPGARPRRRRAALAAFYERMGSALFAGAGEVLGKLDLLAGGRLLYLGDVRRQVSGNWLVE